jgi:hypothetical protein
MDRLLVFAMALPVDDRSQGIIRHQALRQDEMVQNLDPRGVIWHIAVKLGKVVDLVGRICCPEVLRKEQWPDSRIFTWLTGMDWGKAFRVRHLAEDSMRA